MTAHQRLKSWLEAAQIKPAEMARRVEYDKGNFHRFLNGGRQPSLNLAARIERETGGIIPASDWIAQ